MKAAACEPARRYQTAVELAQDLTRFVKDRPVRARPIGSVGRAARWTRRNPIVASRSALLLLLAFASFTGVAAKWRESIAENRRAEYNLSIALDSLDRPLERYASSWMARPISTPGNDAPAAFQITVSDHNAEVLQDALQFYDQFAQQNAANPKLQRDTARVHRRVGDVYERLGRSAKAEQAYRRALGILDVNRDNDPTKLVERATTLNQLGLVMRSTGRFEDAAGQFRLAQQRLQESPLAASPTCRFELARTNSNLGQTLFFLAQHDEARDSHRRAISLLEGLGEQHPREVDYRLALARAYHVYYPFSSHRGHSRDAEQIGATGIAILEQLVLDFPAVPDYQCELSEMLLTTSHRWRDSDSSFHHLQQRQRSVELARELTKKHPYIPRYRALFARGLKEHGESLSRKRPEQGDELIAESIAMYRALAQEFPTSPAYQAFLAMALDSRADSLLKLQRTSDARAALAEAIACQQNFLQLRPEDRFVLFGLLRQHEKLARVLRELGKDDEADDVSQRAEALRSQLPPRRSRRRG